MRPDLAALLSRPIAHRGLHGREHGAVENSLGAAEAAIAAGFGIECDIQLSSDGVALVFHDETLDRLTTASGRIDALASKDLARIRLRHGDETIPTLNAFLNRVDGRVPVVIEIKSGFDADVRLVDEALERIGRYEGVVALKSFDPRVMDRCRRGGAACPLGLVGPHEMSKQPLEAYDFLSWNIEDLAALRSRTPTMPLMTWTIRGRRDEERAQQLGAQIVFEGFKPAPVNEA